MGEHLRHLCHLVQRFFASLLARVHLANLPENRAFFAGTIDSAGSFGGIFQSAVLAYGSVIKNRRPVDTFAKG